MNTSASPVPGLFTLVLHTHLPWLAHHGRWPVGEEWLYQSWAAAYLPLLQVLAALADENRHRLITLGMTPVVNAQLDDPYCLNGVHHWLANWQLRAEEAAQREATPLVNTASSLLITAGLTLTAFAITQPVVNLEPGVTINAVPAAFAVVLIALFVMTTRLHAVSQAAGFLMLDNGIAATAFLLTAGVPLIVELGASLDVLFAVIVIGVLTGRLRRIFGDADLDKLRELRD